MNPVETSGLPHVADDKTDSVSSSSDREARYLTAPIDERGYIDLGSGPPPVVRKVPTEYGDQAWWDGMSHDERIAFIRNARESHHKMEYETALQVAGVDRPRWEDLSEERREAVRAENRRYAAEIRGIVEDVDGVRRP